MSIRMKRSLIMNEQTDFVVDHPFIFNILNKNSSVVFVGRMTKIDSLGNNNLKEEL